MNVSEARQFITAYYRNPNPGEDDKFLFEEAQRVIIDAYHDPRDMHNLAFFYLKEKRHDMELKYLEMAAEYGYAPAIEELGYIWYYGQNGEVDYKKAFEYFSKAAESGDDVVMAWAEHKLSDMYHNGFYVEKDEDKYRRMVEDLYEKMTNPGKLHSVYSYPVESLPFADVQLKLARIRAEDGHADEAMALLSAARTRLAENIRNNPSWWGNVEVIEEVVRLQHKIDPSMEVRDVYDLCALVDVPCKIAFLYGERRFIIEVVKDEEGNVIRFDRKWFRDVRDFFAKAQIDDKKVVYIYDLLRDVEATYG